MRWGKTDPISTLMLAIAGIAAFSVLPLSDSIPQTRVGPTYVRLLLGITVLLRGYELVSCKTSAALCREMNHDFRWPERQLVNLTGCVWQCYAERYPDLRGKYGLDVNKLYEEYVYSGFKRGEDCSCPNSTPTHITATASNSTSVIVDAGPMFSTLDIYESCHSLLIVLSLRMLLSSLTRPTTTNCIRQPSTVRSLHGEANTPGEGSVASKVFGERLGTAHAEFVSRFGKWSILLVVVCKLACVVPMPGVNFLAVMMAITASSHLLFVCLWGPALHLPTLKMLVKVASACIFFV